MDERKELILNTIIREHIISGVPVGSNIIVDKYKLDISPATVRNEMSELEENGYIKQPHTSAGRVPTEAAYDFYIKNLKDKKLNDKDIKLIEEVFNIKDEQSFKQTSKIISNLSQNAVFWAFHRHNLYYTGISNLLSQPEFAQNHLIYDISSVIDRVDEIINDIFDEVDEGVQIMLGAKNPFGNFCSTILTKYKLGDNIGLIGIIGPLRMNYEKNISIIKFIHNKFVNINKNDK